MTCSPRISVVTPSFNQGEFLAATIESVLSQGYPNLEYIVIDGGSSDGSADVIARYAADLAYWVSEPDRGQSHAINKGLHRATGEVMGWLNSDDRLLPGSLELIGEVLGEGGTTAALAGHCRLVYPDGSTLLQRGEFTSRQRLLEAWRPYTMHQPSIWWRREVYEDVGDLDENLHLVMDYDYWLRISARHRFTNVDRVLAEVTVHPEAKTGGDSFRSYHRAMRRHARRQLAMERGGAASLSVHVRLGFAAALESTRGAAVSARRALAAGWRRPDDAR